MVDLKESENHLEIERKFLIKKNFSIPETSQESKIIQSYLFICDKKELRVRIENQVCFLSLKINLKEIVRQEFTYRIPLEEGYELIKLGTTNPPIIKTRYVLPYKNNLWEIDFFKGENEGLVIAEIELQNVEQKFEKPSWIEKEVTHERKYYNSELYQNPYKRWY